jgi:predicted aconitase
MVGGGVPVIKGLSFPSQEALIAMGSAMATSGQIALYHIPGITAECSSVEEVSTKKTIQQTVLVKDTHIKAVYDLLHTAKTESVDFVNLGCPHYSLEQMRRVAFLIKGRKVKEGVLFWVFTNRATKAIADRSGYTHVIEEAGGLVICDCCGTTSHLRQTTRRNLGLPVPAIDNMITDSAKQAKYANTSIGCTTFFTRTEDCIEAAVTGRTMG